MTPKIRRWCHRSQIEHKLHLHLHSNCHPPSCRCHPLSIPSNAIFLRNPKLDTFQLLQSCACPRAFLLLVAVVASAVESRGSRCLVVPPVSWRHAVASAPRPEPREVGCYLSDSDLPPVFSHILPPLAGSVRLGRVFSEQQLVERHELGLCQRFA